MRVAWMVVLAAALAVPAGAQSVRTGIEAWQKGDVAAAVAIWRPLAQGGDADAQFNMGQAYKLGRGVPLDLAQAQLFFERAARQGHSDAQTNLGMLLFQNGNRSSALRWLKAAAEGGDARALLVYGTALFNGDGVAADRVRAYAMVSRAAAQGLSPAQDTLAEMDQLIPIAERQKGVALALQWSKATKAPQPAPAATAIAAKETPKATKRALSAKPEPVRTAARPEPSAPPSAQGGWLIQLGAFSGRAGAETLFRRLSPSLPGKAPKYVAAGAMTRLQVGPFPSRSAANAACRALAARGQACFPVSGG